MSSYEENNLKGSSLQHVVLGKVGVKLTKANYRITKLPYNYKHIIAVNDWLVKWHGQREYKLGKIVADVYYPDKGIAVEIDRGTEGRKALIRKFAEYNKLNISVLCFVAAKERLEIARRHLLINNVLVEPEKIEKAIAYLQSLH